MRLLASLPCFALLLAHIRCEDNMFGIVGENFTFPVNIVPKIVEIMWTKNKNKVAEWEGLNEPTYFDPLHNRSVLMENGSLTIVNLQKHDAGKYQLHYWDSVRDHYLNFSLFVLDPLPEPKISCNTSGSNLVLKCTADFQMSLNYTWKLSNDPRSYQSQSHSVPLENVDPTTKAACVIKFSQTENSSEISLIQCLPVEKGKSSQQRNRGALIAAVIVPVVAVGILVFLFRKGGIKCEARRRAAEKNSPVHGSGEREQLFSGDSQEQPNTDRAVVPAHGSETIEAETMDESEGEKRRKTAAFSQAVNCENEAPEADRKFNEEDSALRDKQTVSNGVNQEDTVKNSSLLANHADDHGINEGGSVRNHEDSAESEVTQDAETGNAEHLSNSPSCSKEDLIS